MDRDAEKRNLRWSCHTAARFEHEAMAGNAGPGSPLSLAYRFRESSISDGLPRVSSATCE